MIVQPSSSRVKSVMDLYCCWLLSGLVNAPNCHLSLVLASVVQGDAVNCNRRFKWTPASHSYFMSIHKPTVVLKRSFGNSLSELCLRH